MISALLSRIPIPWRKSIKSWTEQHFFPLQAVIIDDAARNDWERYAARLPDIVMFGITRFDFRFQRPQHIASLLAQRGYRVFYIENEFRAYRGDITQVPYVARKISDNLYSITLASDHNVFIYSQSMSSRGKKITQNSLKQLFHNAKIVSPLAYVTHPFWQTILPYAGMKVIYDCFDDHAHFKESGRSVTDWEVNLIKMSDAVVASSNRLKTKIAHLRPDEPVILPNAADPQFFQQNTQQPEELKHIRRPLLGYVGAIEDWFDTDILEALLQEDWRIALIGMANNRQVLKLAKHYSDKLIVLGEKPYQSIPGYISTFSVCLIPFRLSPLIEATSPVKFFEYCSAGKPVVSTPLPELENLRDIAYIAREPQQFVEEVKRALHEDSTVLQRKRIKFAEQHTWSKRVEQLERTIKQLCQ